MLIKRVGLAVTISLVIGLTLAMAVLLTAGQAQARARAENVPATLLAPRAETDFAPQATNGNLARAGSVSAAPLVAWTPPLPAWRVQVDADGIYRLDYTALNGAGVPVGAPGFDPRKLRMYYMGQQIPVRVEGEGDGVFNPGDTLLFYGRGVDSLYYDGLVATNKYTGTNSFWLTYGGPLDPDGLRMLDKDGSVAGGAADPFPHKEHQERNFWYDSDTPFAHNADHWIGGQTDWFQVNGLNNVGAKKLIFQAQDIATGSYTGKLQVKLLGAAAGQHTLRLHVNYGQPNGCMVLSGSPTWSDFTIYNVTANVPQSCFLEGTNFVRIELVNIGKSMDKLFIDWVELTYYDTYVARNERLDFNNPTAGAWRYNLTNFTTNDAEVYDVTDLTAVKHFINTTRTGAGPFDVSFGDTVASTSRYIAVTPTAWLPPKAIQPVSYPTSSYAPTDLLTPATGADYVIITHANFWTDAQRLAVHRDTDFTVALIDVQRIYDQFNGGVMSAESIRDFLAHANNNWPTPKPQYVTLIGDGTYDMRNYRYTPLTFVPPYLYLADPDLGETAADNRFVTIVGNDNMPDLHLGRLPVNTPAEAAAMVDKIINYEKNCRCNGWNYNTLFVTDDLDPNVGGGDFYVYSDEVADGQIDPPTNTLKFLPTPPYSVTKAYLGQTCTSEAQCRNIITTTLNMTGALFVSFVGHATKTAWAVPQLLNETVVNQLTNGPCLPIMLPMTCYEGSYHDTEVTALGEASTRLPIHGAIASWSPTGFGLVTGHDYLEKGFVLALTSGAVTRLGPATTAGKQYLIDHAPPNRYLDLLDTFGLLGDPGLKVKTTAVCQEVPTGLRMETMAARAQVGGVQVTWVTASELGMAGFNVLRRTLGPGRAESSFRQVNSTIIAAENAGLDRGGAYHYVDGTALPGTRYAYALEIIGLSGGREQYGLAEVALPARRLFMPLARR